MATQQQNEEQQVSTSIDEHLERLLAFEATTLPVISLYLNAQSDERGRKNFDTFLRRELIPRAKTFASGSQERQSFDADVEKIETFLETELKASANGAAIFACAGASLFETIQLNAPLDDNYLYVYNQPHLYHLTRLDDAFPRYAALVTDANHARIFVFGLGETLETEQVKGKKVQRVKVGGWSQARYQRRVENAHANHAKEAIETLDKIVRQDNIEHIILAGDPQMAPLLQEQMPKHLADKLVDVMKLDLKASDHEVFEATLDRMREEDAKTDAEKVDRLLSSYRGRGLAVAGLDATLEALTNGQVDELLVSGGLEEIHGEEQPIEAILAPEVPDSSGGTESDEPRQVLLADLLVTKAKQIDAKVTFIEDADLLRQVGGIGAFLRWQS